MTSTATVEQIPQTRKEGWFATAENWLDEKGKGAWIVAMILGFILFWPVGLAILLYMIWSKRMFSKSCKSHRSFKAGVSSGNSAFDAYKAETLQRLEDEQRNFEDFLTRLRDAKDKAEFDDFMSERAKAAKAEKSE